MTLTWTMDELRDMWGYDPNETYEVSEDSIKVNGIWFPKDYFEQED